MIQFCVQLIKIVGKAMSQLKKEAKEKARKRVNILNKIIFFIIIISSLAHFLKGPIPSILVLLFT